MMLSAKLILSVFFFFFSALFSAAETAFMSLSRIHLSRLDKAHPGRLRFWQKDPDRALTVLLFLNNLVNAALGVLAVSMSLDVARRLGIPFLWAGAVIPPVTAALLILLGEIAPKIFARHAPERLALVLAPPTERVVRALGPLTQGLLKATGTLLSWLSRTVRTERAQWNASVIRSLLEGAPAVRPIKDLLQNVIRFGAVPVREVMVPREEIFAVDLTLGRDALLRRALRSGYSRVPVHRGSLDNLRGMVYAKDLLAQWRGGGLISVDDLVRPLFRVTPETPLAQVLRVFRQGHHHMALVADAHGRTIGLVTLQDALEAIVGEIAPEPRATPASPRP